MKYKFLYRMLYSFSNRLGFDVTGKCGVDVSELIYNDLYKYIYSFKEVYPGVDIRCLERIFDKYLLCSLELFGKNVDDTFRVLREIIYKSSVEDFITFYFFQLHIDHVIATDVLSCMPDSENHSTLDRNQSYLLQTLSIIFLVLAGGVIYLPLKINNTYFTLGLELDKIFSSNYSGLIYNRHGLQNEFCSERVSSAIINKLITKADTPTLSVCFLSYYSTILNLSVVARLDCSDCILNNLSLDNFKISIVNIISIAEDDLRSSESIYMYRTTRSFSELFYSRNALVPRGGLVIKSDDLDSKILVVEFNNNLFGYMIVTMATVSSLQLTTVESIFLTPKMSTVRRKSPSLDYVIDLYGLTNLTPENGFLSVPTLLNLEKNEIQYMNTVVGPVPSYDVLTPNYWKYKGTQKSTKGNLGEVDDSFIKKKITVSSFKRKLPSGQNRSSDAERLAKTLCVVLKENETIVSSFDRFQRSNHF